MVMMPACKLPSTDAKLPLPKLEIVNVIPSARIWPPAKLVTLPSMLSVPRLSSGVAAPMLVNCSVLTAGPTPRTVRLLIVRLPAGVAELRVIVLVTSLVISTAVWSLDGATPSDHRTSFCQTSLIVAIQLLVANAPRAAVAKNVTTIIVSHKAGVSGRSRSKPHSEIADVRNAIHEAQAKSFVFIVTSETVPTGSRHALLTRRKLKQILAWKSSRFPATAPAEPDNRTPARSSPHQRRGGW